MKNYMSMVNDTDTARAFLAALHAEGMLFHPEEDAFDCLGHHNLPTSDLLRINANMTECFKHLADPCEDALNLVNAE